MTLGTFRNNIEGPTDTSGFPAATTADESDTTASNTNTTLTYAAPSVAAQSHGFGVIGWSYNGTPTGGNLTLKDGAGNVYMDFDITNGGPGFVLFNGALPAGASAVITLAAGGSGVTGKISHVEHYLR